MTAKDKIIAGWPLGIFSAFSALLFKKIRHVLSVEKSNLSVCAELLPGFLMFWT
jgi:hypothetical protein